MKEADDAFNSDDLQVVENRKESNSQSMIEKAQRSKHDIDKRLMHLFWMLNKLEPKVDGEGLGGGGGGDGGGGVDDT